MNYLGIDYGESRVGIALATGPLAEPLTTVKTGKAIQSIKLLITKYKIDAVVMGDCQESFLNELANLVVVYCADETLSSHDARQSLLHTTPKKRRQNEHAVAAAVILQNWLDANPPA